MDRNNGKQNAQTLVNLFKLGYTQAYGSASVINLSNRILNNTEVRVLSKGMKYIPIPKQPPESDIIESLEKFSRHMQIIYHFSDKNWQRQPPKFKIPSDWYPPPEQISDIMMEELKDMSDSIKGIKLTNKQNRLSKNETKVLVELKKDRNIIFKPADKGSSIIIQNRNNYIWEAEKQLSVQLHYKEIPNPIYPKVQNRIIDILYDLKDRKIITRKEYEFLVPPDKIRPRRLYLLPKIHKDISNWHNSIIPPHRPIVSDCSSDTYNLSIYLDYILSPVSTKHSSYIKDTKDFLNKLSQHTVTPNSYLITLDVVSLFTNIDNQEGLQAVKEILNLYPDNSRPDEEFLELLSICLNNNDFQFNDRWFLQIWGTSMGKKFAPKYANIFMAHFENKAISKCSKKPQAYYRFLDDIFILWPFSLEEFDQFLTIFNSEHPTIKFTPTIHETAIDFLDVTIFKGPRFQETGNLDTKVYFKPTDTHQLLHKSSFHPRHTFKAILKSQIIRFRSICNNDSDFEQACKTLFSALTKRGYSRTFIRTIKSETLTPKVTQIQNLGASKACNSNRCFICPKYFNTTKFVTDFEGKKHYLEHEMNCNTVNIIYSIQCLACKKRYVGQTSDKLRIRFNNHKSEILTKKDKPLASHFQTCSELKKLGKLNTPFLKITPLEIVSALPLPPVLHMNENGDLIPHMYDGNSQRNRLLLHQRETFWITKLKSLKPFGLNSGKEAPGTIPFIITHCNQNHQIMTIVRRHYHNILLKFPTIFRHTC